MRKNYSTEFKVRVALESIRERETMAELSSRYNLHASQILRWKRGALEALPEAFSSKRKRKEAEDKELVGELYKQIGQLKVENDWLKKKL